MQQLFIYQRQKISKKTLITIFSALLLTAIFGILMPVTPVSALNGKFIARVTDRASASATRQSADLTRIIQRANSMIALRLTSLQEVQTRVQNDKRLSPDEQSSFVADINTTISNLTALKAKIDADTDATTALTDAKSIVTSYRIFMIYEPKTRLLVIIDNLQTASTTMTTLVGSTQNLLNSLKAQGKDITTAQTALNDISTQLTNINTLLATDKTLLQNTTISTSNPASIFTQVKTDLATVRSYVVKIRTDFQTIRTSLKTTTVSPTSTQ